MSESEFGEEVLTGIPKKNGKKPDQPWQSDFGEITDSDIDRILKVPAIDDAAGFMARGNFKTDNERVCYLRLIKRCQKFELTEQLEFLRTCVASKLGMMAFGKTLQLQSKIQIIAPAVIREQLAMRKVKNKEENVKASDFREDSDSIEPKHKG